MEDLLEIGRQIITDDLKKKEKRLYRYWENPKQRWRKQFSDRPWLWDYNKHGHALFNGLRNYEISPSSTTSDICLEEVDTPIEFDEKTGLVSFIKENGEKSRKLFL